MKRAIFLDRDGTIIKDKNYVYKTEDLEFLDGAVEGIKKFNKAGFLVIIISNQSGVGRGMYTENDAKNFNEFMIEELKKKGAKINDVFFCPHYIHSAIKKYRLDCECRKPKPGLILKAAYKHNIDLANSWMIGNEKKDIETGEAAGCKTVLIRESKSELDLNNQSTYQISEKNLDQAADHILKVSPDSNIR